MRNTKKRVFSVLVALTLCCLTVIPVAAIDTPWLPLEPDGGGTETTATTEPSAPVEPTDPDSDGTVESDAPDSIASSEVQNGTNAPQSTEREDDSSAPQTEQTEETQTKEPLATEKSEGCGSAVSGFGWLAVMGGAWMLCRSKHAEEKEVNE